jgi:hypothetical protein
MIFVSTTNPVQQVTYAAQVDAIGIGIRFDHFFCVAFESFALDNSSLLILQLFVQLHDDEFTERLLEECETQPPCRLASPDTLSGHPLSDAFHRPHNMQLFAVFAMIHPLDQPRHTIHTWTMQSMQYQCQQHGLNMSPATIDHIAHIESTHPLILPSSSDCDTIGTP